MSTNNPFQSMGNRQNWWLSVVIGVLIIAVGIWFLLTPLATVLAFSYFLAFLFLLTGISEIFSISYTHQSWGWVLVSGLLDIFIGIMFLSLPPAQLVVLATFLVGFWILFRSILGIGIALQAKHAGLNVWKMLMTWAVIGAILAFIFLMSPLIASGFIAFMIALSFIFYGIFEISWGMYIKR